MTGITCNDFMKYRFFSNVQYAPDGRHAAFAVSSCDEMQNYYTSCLWVWDEQTQKSFQLTGGGKEQTYIWEDDTHILFAAYRKESEENRQEMGWEFTPMYRIGIDGGEAVKAFEIPVAVRGLKRIDERFLLFLGEIDAKEPDLYRAAYLSRKSVWSQRRRERDYEVMDESPFWQNGRGFINKKRMAVFLYDKESRDFIRISDTMLDTCSVTVLGKKIYYAGERYETKSTRREEIWSYHIESRRHVCIYKDGEYEIERLEGAGNHVLVFASEKMRYGMNENPFLYELDEKKGKLKLLYHTEESAGNTVSSDCRYGVGREVEGRPDGSLYLLSTRRNSCHLFHFTRKGDKWKMVPIVAREGAIDAFAVNPADGSVLCIAMYDGKLQELYKQSADGVISQVSFLNESAFFEKYVAKPEKMTIVSAGEEIDGWVLKPADFSEEKTYPAILSIHGGPKTVYGEVFFHEMQYLAGQQYFVFYCNPIGSDGRGNTFADIRGRYGTVDYENLMDFTDAVLAKYPQIDKKRVAVMGGSYGGFMTNWIIGHTKRFACAISMRSISNWISLWGVSDIGPSFTRDQIQADIGENVEKLWEHSPLRYWRNIETPTLIIHAEEDYRCPMEQGLQMYTALVEQGVPARMCLFKGENHEMSRSGRPKHRMRRLMEITDWLKQWIGAEQ